MEGGQSWSPHWYFRLKLLFLVYFNQMPSPENSTPSVEKTNNEQLVHHTEGEPLSTVAILAKGDTLELKKLDEKYSVVQNPIKTVEDTKPEESIVVTNENLSRNFPDSIIIKQTNDRYFAVRKNKNGEWEGNSFTLMSDGNIGAVYQERTLDKNIIETAEKKLELTIPLLDRELIDNDANEDKRARLIDRLKNVPENEIIKVYHGLKSDLGSGVALSILESSDHGIKQISGPCLSLSPSGAYWKPGATGFEYSLVRGDIEFPGESKEGAHFRLNNIGSIYMINGLDHLSLDTYDGRVLRTIEINEVYEKDEDGFNKASIVNGEWKDLPPVKKVIGLTDEELVIEKKIQKKLKELADIRKKKSKVKLI